MKTESSSANLQNYRRIDWKIIEDLSEEGLDEWQEEESLLRQVLDSLAYFNVKEEFPRLDPGAFKILVLAQKVIRHFIVFGRDKKSFAERCRLKEEGLQNQEKLYGMEKELLRLQRECRKRRRIIEKQQNCIYQGVKPSTFKKCMFCDKTFINETFLSSHLLRRHYKVETKEGKEDITRRESQTQTEEEPIKPQRTEAADICLLLLQFEELKNTVASKEDEIRALQERIKYFNIEENKLISQERFWQAKFKLQAANHNLELEKIKKEFFTKLAARQQANASEANGYDSPTLFKSYSESVRSEFEIQHLKSFQKQIHQNEVVTEVKPLAEEKVGKNTPEDCAGDDYNSIIYENERKSPSSSNERTEILMGQNKIPTHSQVQTPEGLRPVNEVYNYHNLAQQEFKEAFQSYGIGDISSLTRLRDQDYLKYMKAVEDNRLKSPNLSFHRAYYQNVLEDFFDTHRAAFETDSLLSLWKKSRDQGNGDFSKIVQKSPSSKRPSSQITNSSPTCENVDSISENSNSNIVRDSSGDSFVSCVRRRKEGGFFSVEFPVPAPRLIKEQKSRENGYIEVISSEKSLIESEASEAEDKDSDYFEVENDFDTNFSSPRTLKIKPPRPGSRIEHLKNLIEEQLRKSSSKSITSEEEDEEEREKILSISENEFF